MAKITYGDRIGKLGAPLLGCSVVVFDGAREKILVTRRSDNGRWCIPGGHFESGESVSETAIREVLEETGLHVELTRLVGVYSDPNRLLEYADGNRYHVVVLNFEANVVGGELTTSDETTEFVWCYPGEVRALDFMEHQLERIDDTVSPDGAPWVR